MDQAPRYVYLKDLVSVYLWTCFWRWKATDARDFILFRGKGLVQRFGCFMCTSLVV